MHTHHNHAVVYHKNVWLLDGGWLALVRVSTCTSVLHLLGWGHIDSLTNQVLFDCLIHKNYVLTY